MEVKVAQEVLQKAVAQVSKIVMAKPSYPILSNILVNVTSEGIMTLTTTDLDITISVSCGVDAKQNGRFTVPAKTFSDFVGFLPKLEVVLKQEKDKVRVLCGKHEALFPVIPPEEFPEIPQVGEEEEPLVTVKASVIKPVLDKVIFSCSHDISRPIFATVCFEPVDDTLYLVGVDGFRLSRVIMKADIKEGTNSFMIPYDALEEVSRFIEEDDELKIFQVKKGHHIVLKYSTVTIASREVEGVYPDYKSVLPKEEKTKIILSTEEFLNGVKVAKLFTADNVANRVELVFENGNLVIRSEGSEIGENKTEIEVESFEGENFSAAFNGSFLTDVLSRISTDKVVFATFAPSSDEKLRGGIFKELNNENFLHIVMPLASK
jgi:DNA polymerase-3 subunit beta